MNRECSLFKVHPKSALFNFCWLMGHTQGLIAMLKITHGLLEFPMASTFAHTTHKGLRGHTYKLHQQRCQFAITIRAVSFLNKLPAEIVNASSVKSFKTPLDAHWQSLCPEVPILPISSHNPFPQHTSTHAKTNTLITFPICPPPRRL